MNSKQLDIAFPKVIENEINGSILNTIDFSKYDISFEERMACGIGICYGCACKPKQIERGMLRVCKEGPVFPLGVISYDKA